MLQGTLIKIFIDITKLSKKLLEINPTQCKLQSLGKRLSKNIHFRLLILVLMGLNRREVSKVKILCQITFILEQRISLRFMLMMNLRLIILELLVLRVKKDRLRA